MKSMKERKPMNDKAKTKKPIGSETLLSDYKESKELISLLSKKAEEVKKRCLVEKERKP